MDEVGRQAFGIQKSPCVLQVLSLRIDGNEVPIRFFAPAGEIQGRRTLRWRFERVANAPNLYHCSLSRSVGVGFLEQSLQRPCLKVHWAENTACTQMSSKETYLILYQPDRPGNGGHPLLKCSYLI